MEESKKYTFKVPDTFNEKIRLRSYLVGLFPYLETNNAAKKAIKNGQVFINNRNGQTGDWIKAGDLIHFVYPLNKTTDSTTSLDILYEDGDLIIFRKKSGIASSGNRHSFQDLLKTQFSANPSPDGLAYPQLIHRLDKATSGLLIAATNMSSLRILNEMIAENRIKKDYTLICEGHFCSDVQYIEESIDGKEARTEVLRFEHLDTKDPTSRVFVRLHTGRTHQIRKHFLSIGHPLIGDQLYNKEGLNFKTGLLLHAFRLEFKHPKTGKSLLIEDQIPSKISKYASV